MPTASRIEVTESLNKWGGMSVGLDIWGVRPDQHYRGYVHVGRCTDHPADAGARLQNGPSHDSYEANEIWLDFTTDHNGDATTITNKYWGIGAGQQANLVVLHVDGVTDPAACVAVPFQRFGGW
ncbi:hypothetical protein ACFXG4_30260 [Nocardia sp. NPDC059246]|uniref:hypothetical protein n=1 Tax=unclassified Nocardia TaxID=2637762 RepID=UPI0036BE181A